MSRETRFTVHGAPLSVSDEKSVTVVRVLQHATLLTSQEPRIGIKYRSLALLRI
jgi:hypothetical protein